MPVKKEDSINIIPTGIEIGFGTDRDREIEINIIPTGIEITILTEEVKKNDF